jgi:hypothetical protein
MLRRYICRISFLGTAFLSMSCTSGSDDAKAYNRDGGALDGGDAGGAIDARVPDAGALSWYATCGDPICRTDDGRDAGSDACGIEQAPHQPCSHAGAECDPGLGCGVRLRCTDSDPTLRGCPISRADRKSNIRYLNERELERYHDDVIGLGLAHYAYRNDPSAEQRLGFIIEDVEPSRFVEEARDRVDLYAYTSALVAAVQVQEKRIQELERELRALRARSKRPPHRSASLSLLPSNKTSPTR